MAGKSEPSSHVMIRYVGTATALIEVDGVTFMTDPYLSPAETSWTVAPSVNLTSHYTPAFSLETLPPIDCILLSHEDHPDNLDELGRRLLDGRRVVTTPDGAKNLGPRPGVRAITPWETLPLDIGGRHFEVTGTPCRHLPGGQCTGFILTSAEWGATNGLLNAIYFSGDTVYIDELAIIQALFHVTVALLNIGAAVAVLPDGKEPLLITMDGREAAKLAKEIGAELLVPMHFEAWDHFTEDKVRLKEAFDDADITHSVCWLEPGEAVTIPLIDQD